MHRFGGGEYFRYDRARYSAPRWRGWPLARTLPGKNGPRPYQGLWDRCVDVGDAPNFTNWHQGQPDDYHGYQQNCAWFDAGTGRWRALACDGGVRFDPLPWRI